MKLNFTDDADIGDSIISVGTSEQWQISAMVAKMREVVEAPEEPEPETPQTPVQDGAPDKVITFETLPSGLLTIGTGATATTDGTYLTVVANYQNTNCVVNHTFGEGRITFQVGRGPMMLGFHMHATLGGWQMWSNNGLTIQFGWLNGLNNALDEFGSVALPGVMGDLLNIEIETGPNAQGAPITLRAWKAGDLRPVSGVPVRNYRADGTAGSTPMNKGKIRIASQDNNPVVVKSITIRDGSHAPAFSQASFVGRWMPRWEYGRPVMATSRPGASLRFTATGASKVSADFVRAQVSTENPVVAIYRNGAFVKLLEVTYSGTHELLSGLDSAVSHNIEVIVAGVSQNDNRWRYGCGLQLFAIHSDGVIAKWPTGLPTALWNGDSLVEGRAAYVGLGTDALNTCGDRTYAVLASKMLGREPIVNGFGGSGLTVIGSGGWPPAIQSWNNSMHDCQVIDESPDLIFNSFGTNDGNASSAVFRAALVALINSQKAAYPAARIVVIAPSTGTHKLANSQAAADTGVHFIDATGVLAAGDTTDWAHMNEGGHVKSANHVVSKVNQF